MTTPIDVSVIVPTFNRQDLVDATLRSVMDQDLDGTIEIIVIDDGSRDNTVEIVRQLLVDWPTWQLLEQANRGPSAARNAGLVNAKGEFIQFLDSDDHIHPSKLRLQLEQLRARSDLDFSVSGQFHFSGNVTYPPLTRGPRDGLPARAYPDFLQRSHWNPHAPCYRRASLAEAGLWREDMRIYEDWEWAIRLTLMGLQGAWLDAPLAAIRQHPGPRLGINSAADQHKQAQALPQLQAALLDLSYRFPDEMRRSAAALAIWHIRGARKIWRATESKEAVSKFIATARTFPMTWCSSLMLRCAWVVSACGVRY